MIFIFKKSNIFLLLLFKNIKLTLIKTDKAKISNLLENDCNAGKNKIKIKSIEENKNLFDESCRNVESNKTKKENYTCTSLTQKQTNKNDDERSLEVRFKSAKIRYHSYDKRHEKKIKDMVQECEIPHQQQSQIFNFNLMIMKENYANEVQEMVNNKRSTS